MQRQMRPIKKWVLLGCLYLAQGIPFGLFVQAVPVVLRSRGVSLEMVGFSMILALPWALKFLWAPWIDEPPPFPGRWPRRKGWLIPLHLATIALFVFMAIFEWYDSIPALLACVFTVNVLNASQDVATDGLAIELLDPSERGAGNGVQVGAYRAGMILGGGLLLVLIEWVGWQLGCLICAGMLAATLIPLFMYSEPESTRIRDTDGETSGTLWSFLQTNGAAVAILATALFKVGEGFCKAMIRPYLVDAGFVLGEIGRIVGVVGFVAGLIGAAVGGLLAYTVSRPVSMASACGVQAGGVALVWWLAASSDPALSASAIVGLQHFTGGIATVVLFTAMMDWVRPGHTGSDYTVLASTVVLATGLAQTTSGISAATFGYATHFALAAALTLMGGMLSVMVVISNDALRYGFQE